MKDSMVTQMGAGRLSLGRWASLTVLSPCNLVRHEDRRGINWIGYPGQVVPSGNIVGGPICVDDDGRIVTRSCPPSDSATEKYQVPAILIVFVGS